MLGTLGEGSGVASRTDVGFGGRNGRPGEGCCSESLASLGLVRRVVATESPMRVCAVQMENGLLHRWGWVASGVCGQSWDMQHRLLEPKRVLLPP